MDTVRPGTCETQEHRGVARRANGKIDRRRTFCWLAGRNMANALRVRAGGSARRAMLASVPIEKCASSGVRSGERVMRCAGLHPAMYCRPCSRTASELRNGGRWLPRVSLSAGDPKARRHESACLWHLCQLAASRSVPLRVPSRLPGLARGPRGADDPETGS